LWYEWLVRSKSRYPTGHWRLPSWLGLGKLERRELNWLILGLGACALLWIFMVLVGEIAEGETQAFDVMILKALRRRDDPSKPIGPAWLENALLDLTALGGSTVLGLVIVAVVGFLLLQARYRTALFVLITSASGELVSTVMKQAFNRPRPSVVPHLRDVYTTSFPSGHAMESAIVYLTLGAILMRVTESRVTKLYCLGMAMLLTLLVGVSRVYLGVHYPTDVIGGWIIGFVWASVCWLAAEHFETRAGIAAERGKSA
jgi:undecaprenyl-diphosphatase